MKLKQLLILPLVFILTAGVSGCETMKSVTGIGTPAVEITAVSLISIGEQYDAVRNIITQGCKDKVYTVQTCTDFRKFGEKFKVGFPAAKNLWVAGSTYADEGLTAAGAEALAKLVADLAPYLKLVGGK